MRARFFISRSTCGVDFKLSQVCWDDRRSELMTSKLWLYDPDTIYRPDTR